jgi:hypothetical protein
MLCLKRAGVNGSERRTYLSVFLPNFSMLSTENLGVEITITFGRDSFGVCLSSNLYALLR